MLMAVLQRPSLDNHRTMQIEKSLIEDQNRTGIAQHSQKFEQLRSELESSGINVEQIITKLKAFQVTIPSWALGTGGTRFGRFSMGGEPRSLEEKIDDVGIIHSLTQSAGAISLHIPWDVPTDPSTIREQCSSHGITFDAMNSNTFQDQPNAVNSYKFGSLSHNSKDVRKQAIEHNIEVIEHGIALGSKALTIWLADGSSFPGQHNFRKALEHTQESILEIYEAMPQDWNLLIEYKPFEPHFYSMVIPDWGTSMLLAEACGQRAFTLVDLGHHLPNTNIEQIVSVLIMKGKLGGFHFNDSQYGDDDLTCGSLNPYQLFLIFNELIDGELNNSDMSWMIDASHNLKDPMEDLIQSLENINTSYAKALLVNRQELTNAQNINDITRSQEILQRAYLTDVRTLVTEARLQNGGAISPIETYRNLNIRQELILDRGSKVVATGL